MMRLLYPNTGQLQRVIPSFSVFWPTVGGSVSPSAFWSSFGFFEGQVSLG
jgi:hypothetical protein